MLAQAVLSFASAEHNLFALAPIEAMSPETVDGFLQFALTQELGDTKLAAEEGHLVEEQSLSDVIMKALSGKPEAAVDVPTPSTAAPSPAATSPCSTFGGSAPGTPPARLDGALREAAEKSNGDFAIRGSQIGNYWSKVLREDPKLTADYATCTKGSSDIRAAQQAFRAAWCSTLWKVAAKKRKHESIQERSEGKHTEFIPIPVWLRKEGGGEAALNGLKFKVAKCQREGTIHEHFQLNEETNRIEISLGRKVKSEGSREKWTLLEEAVASKSKDSTPEKPQEPKSIDGAPPDDDDTASPGKKAKKATDLQNQPPSWKAVTSQQKVMIRSSAAAYALLRQVQVDSEWKWADKLEEYAVLTAKVTEYEQMMALHSFWSDVNLLEIQEVRKKHSKATMELEAKARAAPMTALCNAFDAGVRTIKNMHAAKKQ